MLQKKAFNRMMAFFVFLVSFLTYWRTIAPTVSFWDCGEFIACSYILGIPHPPGAPLYLLIGRLFSMIPWSPDIALRVNLISALTSALTVMLTYLIIVQLIKIWRGAATTLEDHVIRYASGIIGALAFAFSDTFWFNAVEAEVYAISMFFTAIVFWLVLIWYEKADEPTSDRYLLLILYCVGLAIGIHLLNVLALPAIALVIYFRKTDISFFKLVSGGLLAVITFVTSLVLVNVILTLIYPAYNALLPPFIRLLFPELTKLETPGFGSAALVLIPFYIWGHIVLYRRYTEYRFYSSNALLAAITAIIVVAIYPGIVKGVPWLIDKGEFGVINPLLLVTISLTVVFYLFPKFEFKGALSRQITGVIFTAIGVLSLLWYFVSGSQIWNTNIILGAIVLLAFVGLAFGFSKWIRYRVMQLVLLGFLLVLTGASTYLMIFIRSGLNPEIDENDPETTQSMVMYLNRDQYGQWSITDRERWKPESRFKYSGEMDYLWRYQIERMYLRYFAWNFMGKGVEMDVDGYIKDTYSFRGLFWLPFLLGLIGMVFHFSKDWKQALSILVLFIMTGVAIVIYLNQEDPQPRERDYVFVASFFAFALWIGLGVTAILEKISEWFPENKTRSAIYQGLAVLLIAVLVPVNMYAFEFHEHDRTGDYVAYDYSYNILQSCDQNGILFTNGDNDTFPLWYLQCCVRDPQTGKMGIRKDVRVVNLSLLNTNWYIKQLKNQEPKVPISLSDAEIDRLVPIPWKAQTLTLNVPNDKYYDDIPDVTVRQQLMQSDTAKSREIAFEVAPTLGSREQGGIRVQDQMILNILYANQWKKPIYFAVTVSRSNQLISTKNKTFNFERYLRMDGLTFKVVSYPDEVIEPRLIEHRMLHEFKYRGLNDPSVYYDDNIIGLLSNYRAGFMRLAYHYREKNDNANMARVLDKMEELIPESVIPMPSVGFLLGISDLYSKAGFKDRADKMMTRIINYPANAEDKLRIAWQLFSQGNLDLSEMMIKQALQQNLPKDWKDQAETMLGYIQQMRQQPAATDSATKADTSSN